MSTFKVLTAGLAVVVLWASAFPAIRVAAPDLRVIGPSVATLAVASLSLIAVAPLAHVRWPERWHLPLLVAAGFFGMTAYQLLLNAAELHVPAGTASILVAAAPLISVAIATLFLGEQLTMATSTSLLYLVPAFAVLIGFIWLGEVPLVGDLVGVVVIGGVVLVGLGDRGATLHRHARHPRLVVAHTNRPCCGHHRTVGVR
jgi:drug/metabolite transporter (DMT)-like permease